MSTTRAHTSLVGVAIAVSLGIGVFVGFALPDDDLFELRKNLRIFGGVYEKVVTGYVEPVDPGHLMRVGVDAMLTELDPYTSLIDKSETARIDLITEGQYGGVGLQVDRRGGRIAVVSPVEGTSGYEEGVRTGDVITEIAGQAADQLSVDDVEALLRGEPGSTVSITVEREGEPAPLTFTLTREQVEVPDVTYWGRIGAEKQVGYVKLERFTRDAPGEVEAALKEFQGTGSLQGVVLDLRDNPGGLLRAAVRITGLFVPQGSIVVSTRGRDESEGEPFRSERAPLMPDVPVVILVNGKSASASEIVAGAIQDLDRGVVMGTTTYGKGLVQKVQSLPHNMALKLTTAQYYTPSGRTIQNLAAAPDSTGSSSAGQAHETEAGRIVRDADGIRPDVQVQASTASALERALTRKAAFFRYANQYAATHDTLATDFAVTDADVSAFRLWLDQKDLRYPTRAQQLLDSLRVQTETNGHEAVQDDVTALAEALRAAKQSDFDRHTAELKRHLKREILARYVPADRQVAMLLPGDSQVRAATELLVERERYERILAPPSER